MTNRMIWHLAFVLASIVFFGASLLLLWMSFPADGDIGYTLATGSAMGLLIGVVLAILASVIKEADK